MKKKDTKMLDGLLIISPIYIDISRETKKDKRIYLNLNVYRNLHYIVNNQAKHIYLETIKTQIEKLRFDNQIEIHFTLFEKSKRKVDRSNVLSIVEKFFCDSLVTCGCLDDDNDNFIKSTHYYSGGVDSKNPRVEILIKEAI